MFLISHRTINSGMYGWQVVQQIAMKESVASFYKGFVASSAVMAVASFD